MARETKWVNSAKSRLTLVDAARQTLNARVDEFRQRLKAAVGSGTARNVHRVRVAARRLLAARRFFRDLLPDRRSKWLKKQVRRAHRAAGEVRNLDVFVGSHRASLDANTLATFRTQRRMAYRGLLDANKRLKQGHFGRRAQALLRRVRRREKKEAPLFGDEGLRRLRGVAGEFVARAARTGATPESLHALRVAGKRLRYTVELCENLIRPAHRGELLRRLEQFQDAMGAISDAAMAMEFSRRLAPDAASLARQRSTLEAAIRNYQKQFPRRWFRQLAAMFA